MGQIKVKKNAGGIEGLYIIEPAIHGDSTQRHLWQMVRCFTFRSK